ncbi:hypothetical protein [Yoonia sp. BS5-3]|uniref:Uncharacterized protein n=1 Tax=Yoonia phaeophyticola TaxID=3137369 RepID=A0ABZ2V5T9_9RHOB
MDGITRPEFPADLARVLPSAKLITFDSIMETARRQHHGLKIRQGKYVLRKAFTTIGFEKHRWEWHEEGKPEPFEDCALYQSRQITARFNRPIMTRYIKSFGIDPDRSLFGRNFKASLHLWPLPDNEPAAIQFYCTDYDDQAVHARSCGLRKYSPSDLDDMFEEENFEQTALDLKNMDRWAKTIQQARWKAGQSAERAKTPSGRLRAQWRVVDAVKQIQEEALAAGLDPHVARSLSNTGGLNAVMKELGEDTEAYVAYQDCYTK